MRGGLLQRHREGIQCLTVVREEGLEGAQLVRSLVDVLIQEGQRVPQVLPVGQTLGYLIL